MFVVAMRRDWNALGLAHGCDVNRVDKVRLRYERREALASREKREDFRLAVGMGRDQGMKWK
jgi:hypothetical protein